MDGIGYKNKINYQGPRLVTCGIWKDVYLEAFNNSELPYVYIRTLEISEDVAVLNAQFELRVSTPGEYKLVLKNMNTSEVFTVV